MLVLNRYILKNLLFSTVFITLMLSSVLILTQSLRFLELIIEAGAEVGTFWALSFLALPRFLEVLLPLSVMISIVFIYNRMAESSELVVLRTSGFSPLALARPALMAAAIITMFLWFVTFWAAPKSLSAMQEMRQFVKAQFSSALLRDRVFNRMGNDITVYIQNRSDEGILEGLVIHDKRDKSAPPSTVLAERGIVTSEDGAYKVVVYDGTRQSYDPARGVLQRLDFERYTIDLPTSTDVRARWQQPDERTFWELMNPDLGTARDADNVYEFRVEAHRRIATPLLTIAFAMIALVMLVMGPVNRRGQASRLVSIVLLCVVLQGLFMAAYNMAGQAVAGIFVMYGLVLLPIIGGGFLLSGFGEQWRRSLLYKRREKGQL